MVIRGGVYWIDLDKRRPCVVVSSPDVLGVDVWQTHVVPLTSNVGRADLAGNVLLDAAVTGLSKDSVAIPLGLELVDRSWLGKQVGQLPLPLVAAIDNGIRGSGAVRTRWQATVRSSGVVGGPRSRLGRSRRWCRVRGLAARCCLV